MNIQKINEHYFGETSTKTPKSCMIDISDDHLIPEVKLEEEMEFLKSDNELMDTFSDSDSAEESFIPKDMGMSQNVKGYFAKDFFRGISSKPETSKSYPCPYCNFIGKLRGELREHMKNHAEHPFRCLVCGNICSNNGNLKRHMLIHTGERPYQCSDCELGFKTKTLLKIHVLKHTGERPYKCNVCPATFTQGSHLKKHMGKHERDQRDVLQCVFCEFSTRIPEEIQKHQLLHTTKLEETLRCNMYDYGRHSCTNIQQPFFKHSDNSSFKCNLREKSFKSSKNLIRHTTRHATAHDERKFKCPLCDHTSKQSSHLKKHLLIHQGEKIVCPVCSLKCKCEEVLEKHMLKHKEEKNL